MVKIDGNNISNNNKDQPSKDDIINAISQSGYLMEQEVAEILKSIKFNVETNCAYKDIDEFKSREIDIIASQSIHNNYDVWSSVKLICECKNFSNPLVFIGRKRKYRDIEYIPPHSFVTVTNNKTNELHCVPISEELYSALELHNFDYYFINDKKPVQFSKIIRNKDKWEATHDDVYNSIINPLVKAYLYLEYIESLELSKMTNLKSIYSFFPLAIINSDIYYIDYTTKNIEPIKVPYLTYTTEIHSNKINGKVRIDFVKKEHLKSFIRNSIKPYNRTLLRKFSYYKNLYFNIS